ncbi:MAG: CoA ester lyase [Pseudorhodoplanes sp.]|jgi:citrate lyase subunit beta/citryl-CoA lyase|nr:CoA ester lyase [Pseudorhodoplanes sp.]
MRSYLFVPGDSPKKLDKGLTSGADAVLIDLEDSISAQRKAEARQITAAFLIEAIAAANRPRLYVRVNGHQTGLIDDDLDVVMAARPDGILLPKAEGGACVTLLDAKLTAREAIHGIPDGDTKIMVLATETAAAMFTAGSYKGSSPRLMGLTWGAEDLSAEIGAEANRDKDGHFLDPYRLARSICLTAAAAAGVQAIDTVYVDFRNVDGFRRETEEGRRDGFTGRMAIHPAQVPIINEVFTPTQAAINHAQRVIAAFAAANGAGTVGIDGMMYDRPHLVRAQQLMTRAKTAGLA